MGYWPSGLVMTVGVKAIQKVIEKIRDAKRGGKASPEAMDALHKAERMLMTSIGQVPSTYSGRVSKPGTRIRRSLRPLKARRQARKKGPQATAAE